MVGIIDYGAGNLKSIQKALDYLGFSSLILANKKDFRNISRIILPGVGAFGQAVKQLQKKQLLLSVKGWIKEGKPFLGICLGLQLLFASSEESPEYGGLSFFQGKCLKFNERKVPQIGWNKVLIKKNSPLFFDLPDESYFYFVHSYYVLPEKENYVVGITNYGIDFPSIMAKGRIFGVQFHPEKSGPVGLKMLRNWVEKC